MKHENVVLFDNAGLPSVMVKFTPEAGKPLDPVFMVCGRRAKAIYISSMKMRWSRAFRVPSRMQRLRTVLTLTQQAHFAAARVPDGI